MCSEAFTKFHLTGIFLSVCLFPAQVHLLHPCLGFVSKGGVLRHYLKNKSGVCLFFFCFFFVCFLLLFFSVVVSFCFCVVVFVVVFSSFFLSFFFFFLSFFFFFFFF